MTETQWLEGTDPVPMLEFVRGRASERKLRLFAAALCGGVGLAERHADSEANAEEVYQASLDAVRGVEGQARYFWRLAMTDSCRPDIRRYVAEVLRLVQLGDSWWYKYEGGGDSSERGNAYNV